MTSKTALADSPGHRREAASARTTPKTHLSCRTSAPQQFVPLALVLAGKSAGEDSNLFAVFVTGRDVVRGETRWELERNE